MNKKEYVFDSENPDKYPFGYSVVKRKERAGMEYDLYIPNLPPIGNWTRSVAIFNSRFIFVLEK